MLGREDIGREWGYTALSRAREGTRLYLVAGEGLREELAEELGGRHQLHERDAITELTRRLGRSLAKEMSLDLEP